MNYQTDLALERAGFVAVSFLERLADSGVLLVDQPQVNFAGGLEPSVGETVADLALERGQVLAV